MPLVDVGEEVVAELILVVFSTGVAVSVSEQQQSKCIPWVEVGAVSDPVPEDTSLVLEGRVLEIPVVVETGESLSYLFSFQRKAMPRECKAPLTYTQPSRRGSEMCWNLVLPPSLTYARYLQAPLY